MTATRTEGCPPWHFLPGPYQDDEERTECPNRGTHAAQRAAYYALDDLPDVTEGSDADD